MSNVIDGGAMARRFTENSKNFTGNKASGGTATSQLSNAVVNATAQLQALAQSNGISMLEAADKVLRNSQSELFQYITFKGEVPASNIDGAIAQAALLRAQDIATIANACDLSDADALAEMEAAETEAINNGTADVVLMPDVQAALNIVMGYFQDEVNARNGSQSLSSSLAAVKAAGGYTYNGVDMSSDTIDIGSLLPSDPTAVDVSSPDTSGLSDTVPAKVATQGVDTSVLQNTSLASVSPASNIAAQTLTATPSAAAAISNNAAASSGTGAVPWTSLLSGIASTVSAVTTGVKSIGATVQGTANNLGSGAISTYIAQNPGTVIIYFLIAAVIIYFVVKTTSK